jgi:hypothetical protein
LDKGEKVAREEVKMSLAETLRDMQKAAVEKRKLAMIYAPLPEEQAYQESIDPDVFLTQIFF